MVVGCSEFELLQGFRLYSIRVPRFRVPGIGFLGFGLKL